MKQTKIWQPLFIALAITTAISGCKKEEDPIDNSFAGNGTFIICEGQFGTGNSRLDFYNKNTEELSTDLFQSVNGLPLGDVFQSMLVVDDQAFLVVNNSGKIEVVNPTDLTSTGTITGLSSPRYVCVINASKAYVSQLYTNEIKIINTNDLTVSGSITYPGWSEEMLNNGGKIWVTNTNSINAYILQNDVIVDSVNVGFGSSSIRKDANGKIWILTGGNYMDNTPSKISRVNPTSNDVEWDYTFTTFGASKLRTNAANSVLYFLYDGKVYRKDASDVSSPTEFISISGKYFYGLNVDPSTGNIWISDAGDFASPGTVYIYNSSGTEIKNFTTGVVPSDFVF